MRLVDARSLAPEALHACFQAAFADYLIGPMTLPLADWPAWLAQQGIELALSRVAVDAAERPLAFAFTAPRPLLRRWRLAGMGAVPAARGQGAAPALLTDWLARAAAQAQQAVELEVFAQNGRARQLYERAGFEARHELHGYRGRPQGRAAGAVGAVQPEALAREDALRWLAEAECTVPGLPLQQGPTPLRARHDWQAWRWGRALAVLQRPAADAPADAALRVFSLVDHDPVQRDAQALLAALAAQDASTATRPWWVPQLQRPDLGGLALQRLGLQREPLHQLWMLRPLAGG